MYKTSFLVNFIILHFFYYRDPIEKREFHLDQHLDNLLNQHIDNLTNYPIPSLDSLLPENPAYSPVDVRDFS